MDNNLIENTVCGNCTQQAPHVDYTISLFHYENPVDYLIGQMKFQQQLSSAAILGSLLKKAVEENIDEGLPDAILPVPLHKSRLVKRGFNQSLEISRGIAKQYQLPIMLNTITRKKNTEAQTHLSKKQRLKNVKDCFQLLKRPSAEHIVIVDDVITTGATSNELAKLLKANGVKKVGVWSLARAELD